MALGTNRVEIGNQGEGEDEMRAAYADPPYIGQAKKFYSDDPRCAEVDHEVLLAELCAGYDAWALSCSSNTLRRILRLPACPEDIRIASWIKPWASYKPGVNPAYTWEPVLFYGSRKRDRAEDKVRDSVVAAVPMGQQITGTKPRHFCYWLFELLGLRPGDEFIDLFPGSGAVSAAWRDWQISERDKVESQPLWLLD
jgi:hypothetical protein